MKSFVALLFFALAFVAGVFASTPEYEDGVAVLTNDNFDDFVNSNGIALVEFYAPWCGHCKKLTPEYAKAAKSLKGTVALAKVDCTVENALQSRFSVSGYPTLKIFRGGKDSEYKGPREADGIVSFMRKQAEPSISVLKTNADVDKFIADHAAVVYFGTPKGKLYETFEKLSGANREVFRFAQTDAKEVTDKWQHADGQIVFIQSKRYSQSPVESAKVVADANTESGLLKWIQDNFLPFVGEITNDNSALYKAASKPIIKFYTDLDWKLNPKGANYILNRIRKVARDYKDKFVFAVASKAQNAKEIEDSGLKGDFSFAIHNTAGHKYPAPDAFSPESLKKHIAEYIAEKLEPYVKSEAVPASQGDGATVVVGKTFDSIVNDPTKDVLLEAYAPWCGHCKTLAPKYDELAQKIKGFSDNVVIAKIDATANDIPSKYNVRGFPTIFWVPANKKDSPVQYEGGREVNDFIKYIKKQTTLPTLKQESNKKTEL